MQGQDFNWNTTANDAFDGDAALSAMSDHGNDSSYEISELGTPRLDRGDSSFDLNIDHFDSAPKYGIFSKNFILENLERISRTKLRIGDNSINERRKHISYHVAGVKHQTEALKLDTDSLKLPGHTRYMSSESVGSDISSTRNRETSNFELPNSFGDSSLDLPEDTEDVRNRDFSVAFLMEERQKLNRVLSTVRQRLSTAKTDMEDLIARLNQETTVRQFLATKVSPMHTFSTFH